MGRSAKTIILILAVVFLGTATAETTSQLKMKMEPQSSAGHWAGDWKTELGGVSHDEGKDEYVAAYASVLARVNYTLVKNLRLVASPLVEVMGGRIQQRFDDSEKSQFSVIEAFAAYQPLKFVDLRAGIHSQRFLELPQLVSSKGRMPGFQEIVGYDFSERFSAKVVAQQLVPTSTSLSTERQDKEKMPMFQTQSLHLGGIASDWFEWDVVGGHFQWSQLPAKVAFDSAIDGNSVDGELAPGSRFRYGFEGLFWGGEFLAGPAGYPQHVFAYRASTNYLAPVDAADAEMLSTGVRWVHRSIEYKALYHHFYTEPDASVAYYTTSKMGRNNREGDGVELKVDFKELKFAVRGEFYTAHTINESSTQDTWNYYKLNLETNYAPF